MAATPPMPTRAVDWWPRLLVCALILAYLALPTRNYNGDILALLQRVRHLPWWAHFDPNHFAWGPLIALLLAPFRTLSERAPYGSEIYLLQALNGLIGLALLKVIHDWARELKLEKSQALLVTTLVAMSFTYWQFAIDPNMYVLVTLLLTLAMRAAWRWATGGPDRSVVQSALFASAALLLHQLAIVVIPALWVMLWQRPGTAPGTRQRTILKHLLIGVLLVGGSYAAVAEGLYRGTPYGGLRNFLINPQSTGRAAEWAPSRWGSRPHYWAYAIALGEWNLHWYADHPLVYAAYTKPEGSALFDQSAIAILLPGLWALALIAWTWSAWRHRPREGDVGVAVRGLWIWLTMGWLFCAALSPTLSYYRLLYLPAFALLAGLWIAQDPARRERLGWGLCGAMALWNLALGIVPNSAYGRVAPYAQAIAWRSTMGPDDLLLTGDDETHFLVQHLRAFTDVRWIGERRQQLLFLEEGATAPLPTEFESLWLQGPLAYRLRKGETLRFPFRRTIDAPLEVLEVSAEEWVLGRGLTGEFMPVEWRSLRWPGRHEPSAKGVE